MAAINETDDQEEQLYRQWAFSVLRQVNFWYLSVVIVVGLLGNALSVVIICRSKLRRIPSNHYLIALSASDSVFLIALLMIWLSKLDLPVYHRQGACQLVLFCLNCSSWLSSWYITILTVERFFVVFFPLSHAARCSIGRTRRIIVLALPIPILFNTSVFVATGVGESGLCNAKESFYYTGMILNWFDTLLSFVLPALVVVACNVAICVRLYSRRNVFASLQGGKAPADGGANTDRRHSATGTDAPLMRCHDASHRRQSQERKITQSLVILSFIFVLLNVPSYAMRVCGYIMVATDRVPVQQALSDIVLENVFNLIYYSNFAVNFFVYCLSSGNFRSAALKMWTDKTGLLIGAKQGQPA